MRSLCHRALVLAALCVVGCGATDDESPTAPADAGADASDDAAAPAPDASPAPDGGDGCPPFCDDGLSCTTGECVAGECVYTPLANFCVVDGACRTTDELHPTDPCLLCDPGVAQDAYSPVPDGIACDDGDACTSGDVCTSGVCAGQPTDCDDGDPCTDDGCDAATGVCTFAANEAPCDDGNPCTIDDRCSGGQCTPGSAACDDGDACTDDHCDPATGACSTSPVDCEDGNPCTSHTCAAATGCVYTPLGGQPCEAGNLCLQGDVCVGATCQEGTVSVGCLQDGNPCTANVCVPEVGCVAAFSDGACDDGYACTSNDKCLAGLCVGSITGDCGCPEPSFGGQVQKATLLSVGGDGHPGAGLDVDEDPTTCAPVNQCSAGIDNAMADLSPFLNPTLADAIESGNWVTVAELSGVNGSAIPFQLDIYGALPVPGASCDVQQEVCEYEVFKESFQPDCAPAISIPDAIIEGNSLVAGGPGSVFTIGLPLGGGAPVNLLIFDARLVAQVQWDDRGEQIESIVGLVAGAVPKAVIFDVLSKIDPSLIGDISIPELLAIVEVVLDEDLDLDGDGVPDAASVGMRLSTIPGIIVGVKP